MAGVQEHCAICLSLGREVDLGNIILSDAVSQRTTTMYSVWVRDTVGNDHLGTFYNLVVTFTKDGAPSAMYPTKHFILAPREGKSEQQIVTLTGS